MAALYCYFLIIKQEYGVPISTLSKHFKTKIFVILENHCQILALNAIQIRLYGMA